MDTKVNLDFIAFAACQLYKDYDTYGYYDNYLNVGESEAETEQNCIADIMDDITGTAENTLLLLEDIMLYSCELRNTAFVLWQELVKLNQEKGR